METQSYEYCSMEACLLGLGQDGRAGAPVRVLRTITVPDTAGFAYRGRGGATVTDQADAAQAKQLDLRKHLEKYDRKVIDDDVADLVRRIKHAIAWYDRDSGSAFDITSWIDYLTRAADSKLENQRKYLAKINAEMRDLERMAKNSDEFDSERWRSLSWQKQACIRSGFLFRDSLEAHHIVRADTYARAGRTMGSYKSWATMKKDKDLYHKLKIAEIDADKLVGMDPALFASWKKLTHVGALPYMTPEEIEKIETERQIRDSTAELGGVEIRTNETGGTARDQQMLRDQQARAKLKQLEDDAKSDAEWAKRHKKRKARSVPKAKPEPEADGETGSSGTEGVSTED